MAAQNYDDCLQRLLAHEGGYSNHPSDPGGPTNFGITIGDYRKYVKPDAVAADVRVMQIADAKRIYHEKYWNAMCCDALPAGIDNAVFDYGVNSGIARAAKVLRRVLGLDASDSVVSPQVIETAIRGDAAAVVNAICDERLRFLRSQRTWSVFGTGWGRRVAEVRAAALAMAADPSARVARDAPAKAPSTGKGVVPLNRPAQTGTTGGVCAAGGACAAHSNEPAVLLAILAVTVAVAISGFLFWRWWQRRQQQAPA